MTVCGHKRSIMFFAKSSHSTGAFDNPQRTFIRRTALAAEPSCRLVHGNLYRHFAKLN